MTAKRAVEFLARATYQCLGPSEARLGAIQYGKALGHCSIVVSKTELADDHPYPWDVELWAFAGAETWQLSVRSLSSTRLITVLSDIERRWGGREAEATNNAASGEHLC